MKREQVEINTPFIKLDSFLKLCGAAETGGHAKEIVQSGKVMLNGNICLERGKKLRSGDVAELDGNSYEVVLVED